MYAEQIHCQLFMRTEYRSEKMWHKWRLTISDCVFFSKFENCPPLFISWASSDMPSSHVTWDLFWSFVSHAAFRNLLSKAREWHIQISHPTLYVVYPMDYWFGSSKTTYRVRWMIWICYSRALERRCLAGWLSKNGQQSLKLRTGGQQTETGQWLLQLS